MALKQDIEFSASHSSRKNNRTFKGFIGQQEILILLDSGSPGTFVSQEVAAQIKRQKHSCPALQFTVADGQLMLYDTMFTQMTWHIQGQTFSHDTRVLPLKCYDMTLGVDWFESNIPMWIHWKNKFLKFTYLKKRTVLHGIWDELAK